MYLFQTFEFRNYLCKAVGLHNGEAEGKTRNACSKSIPFSTAQCSCAHWVLVEIISLSWRAAMTSFLVFLGSTCRDFPIKVVAGCEQLKGNQICYKNRVWNKWAVSA